MVKRKIYLDNNGTTEMRAEVKDLISTALNTGWANPSSQSEDAEEAKRLISVSRGRVSNLLNCSPEEILFTSGGTESNNMVLHTLTRTFKKPHIVISAVEHDSVALYARELVRQELISLTEVELNASGNLNVKDVIAACTEDTCLVSIMLANNETGVIFPISEITKQLKGAFSRILVHTDAAQAIGKIPVDVIKLGVDYLTIVGHKFYGPRIGALYHHGSAPLAPMFFGGGQEGSLRPGTENTPMIAGLGLAAELAARNLKAESAQLRECRDYLEAHLQKAFCEKLVVNCRQSPRLPNTCNFALFLPNCRSINVLGRVDFIASKGAACHSHSTSKPSQILIKSGVSHEVAMNSLRVSVGIHTTKRDLNLVVENLVQVTKDLANI